VVLLGVKKWLLLLSLAGFLLSMDWELLLNVVMIPFKCLQRAKLDFDVDLVPVKNPITGERIIGGVEKDDLGVDREVDKYFAAVRRDTQSVLGIVEGRFRDLPNREVFSIADNMVHEDGAIITRAAAVDGGARCFLNLEWPRKKAINVVGDLVGRRAIMTNAHNGKYSAIVCLIPMRLACINGMVVPIPTFSFEFRIKHTESGRLRLNEARSIMSGASRYFETFGRVAKRMAKTPVTNAHAKKLLKSLPGMEKNTTAIKNRRHAILDLFSGSQVNGNHEAVKNTAWGFLNAISEFADHSGRVRKTRGNTEATQRFKNMIEGAGQRLKLNAYSALLEDGNLGLGEFQKGA